MPRNDTLYLVDAKEARNTFLYAPTTKQNSNDFLYTCYGTNGPVAMSDPDALAYATAGGVLTTPERLALNGLTASLKSAGLWSKMHAIYPMTPNNAALADAYKLNLKNVALHELTIPGTVTCTTQGLRNSSGSFSQCTSTTLNWAVVAPENLSIGVYYKDYGVPAFNQTDVSLSGAVTVSVQTRTSVAPGALAGEAGYNIDTPNTPTTSLAGLSASPGLHVVTRSAGVTSYFVNSTAIAVSPTGALQTATSGGQFGLGSAATAPISFAFVATSLTQLELNSLQNIVGTYQSALSRRFTGIAGPIESTNFIQAAQLRRWRHAEIVNDLIIGLQADNLWPLIQVLYPFIGGTAAAHSINAKNPLQYQLIFALTTHDNNGVTLGPVANNTNYTLLDSNPYYGTYITGGANVNGADFYAVSAGSRVSFYSYYLGTSYSDLGNFTSGRLTSETDVAINRYAATTRINGASHIFRNGASVASAVTSAPTYNSVVNLGGEGADAAVNRRTALCVIANSLTPAQHTLLYNRIQTYQTALGRAV